MEEPLLSKEKSQSDGKKWRSYESLGRSSSVLPTTPLPGIEINIDEIWSAMAINPLISSLEPSYLPPNEQAVGYQGCEGCRDVFFPTCNSGQQPGYYNENQRFQCGSYYGQGLIAHKDGSDSICTKCDGKGKVPCGTYGSRGLIKCESCKGSGSLLSLDIAIVKWKTLSTRKVSATSEAASVPDEVFHKAKGVQLCNLRPISVVLHFLKASTRKNKNVD